MDSTATGIPIECCDVCGGRHPLTRKHCPDCGLATLFGHDFCERADE